MSLSSNQQGVLCESVTGLLVRWSHGDRDALDELTPLVYDELHRLAQAYLRKQRPAHTLQATALVHEAYVRLLDIQHIEWEGRAHFTCLMAQLMRRVLVDHARKHDAQKRGGDEIRVPFSRAERVEGTANLDLVELNEALDRFTEHFPRQAKVIELHFFGGLSVEEMSKVLAAEGAPLSTRTVERDLKFARAWLRKEMDHS